MERLLFALAEKMPNTKLIGYEIFIIPYLIAMIRKNFSKDKYKNVYIYWGDFFQKSIHQADAIICFLMSKSYPRLIEKFRNELKEEAMIIIEAWPLSGYEPKEVWETDKALRFNIYNAKQLKK
jgi:hypothetical protein